LEPASHIEGPQLQRCKLALEISHVTTNRGALHSTNKQKCVIAAKHKTFTLKISRITANRSALQAAHVLQIQVSQRLCMHITPACKLHHDCPRTRCHIKHADTSAGCTLVTQRTDVPAQQKTAFHRVCNEKVLMGAHALTVTTQRLGAVSATAALVVPLPAFFSACPSSNTTRLHMCANVSAAAGKAAAGQWSPQTLAKITSWRTHSDA
jgi:hypothetical protein